MESFIKIGPLLWAVEMTQTDTHTDTLGSIATYSVKLTEYKKSVAALRAPNSCTAQRELRSVGALWAPML